jgi:hypothetical protein
MYAVVRRCGWCGVVARWGCQYLGLRGRDFLVLMIIARDPKSLLNFHSSTPFISSSSM